MLIAQVKGHMVCTVKLDGFVGEKLLIVAPMDHTGKPDGTEIIACDRAGAGVGDVVLLLQEGASNRLIMGKKDLPVEALIVGVIDRVNV
jgi:ethanolamine utilization protein EutN